MSRESYNGESKSSLAELSNEELFFKITSGDDSGSTELFSRIHPRAMNAIRQFGVPRDDAEDFVQEAWMNALQCCESYRQDSAFYTWFYRIMVNKVRDSIRRQKSKAARLMKQTGDVHIALGDIIADNATLEPIENLLDEERDNIMRAVLKKLPFKSRLVIERVDIGGSTYEQFASENGMPIGTVRSQLHRAHEQCRILAEEYLADYL